VRRLPFLVRLAPLLFCLAGCRADESRESMPILLCAELPAPQPLPKATAHYALSVRLDAERHEVHGRGTITWTNRSDRPTSELYLHLYLNAFQKGSRFLRGPAGRSGGLVGREGRIAVERLTSPTFGGIDLWRGADAHSAGDAADRTDIRVPLPRPVAVGETLELGVEFVSVLPQIVERTGYAGDFHLLGQWFPKLARLEPDGRWAHFPFHAFAEFYADFDDYEIVLDVPARHTVGASGTLTKLGGAEPGRQRYLAQAASVIDFAWTASPELERGTRRLGGTTVHLLWAEDEPRVREATWQTLDAGLRELGRWLGEYPYPELTVVIPPADAARAGGMEYPSFITTGGGEMAERLGIRAAPLLVIHELAHQWFQSLVATNEVLFPMLDEGLASYAEWRFLESQYGTASLASLLGLRLSRTAGGRFATFYGRTDPVRVNQPAEDFPSFSALAREIYGRTPLILETLARTHGRERVDSAIAAYARRGRGAHPTPADFYATLAEYLGDDELPTLRELFDEPGHFNLRLDSLSTRARAGGGFESSLVVLREGGPALPYQVAIELEGGQRIELDADGKSARDTLVFAHAQPVARVVLDPAERLLLDEDPADDRLDPKTRALPDTLPEALLSVVTRGAELASFGLSP